MSEVKSKERIVNIPNGITGFRIIGAVERSIQYARTGRAKHFIQAGAYFLLDLLDGPAARLFKQETQFGKKFDPVADKITAGGIIGAALIQGTVDKPVALAVGTVDISNIAATGVGMLRHSPVEVTESGKRSQFRMNVGLGINVLGHEIIRTSNNPLAKLGGQIVRVAGGATAIVSASTLGVETTRDYWHQALGGVTTPQPEESNDYWFGPDSTPAIAE